MRNRPPLILTAFVLIAGICEAQSPDALRELRNAIQNHSGIRVALERDELPPGTYHDLMVPLPSSRRVSAARILLTELQRFPKHYLRSVGLETIGIFESCASRQGDGFRPFDKQLGGYRYYGIYNGKNAIAAAYYSDGQLPLTIQHEVFHHIDATAGQARNADHRWSQVLSGKNRYPAPALQPADLKVLKRISNGSALTDAVSDYAQKNEAEDKAETARHLMSNLPNCLVQVVEQPELPGSQRLLHVLDTYRRVPNENGPSIDWFVQTALNHPASSKKNSEDPRAKEARVLAAQLKSVGSAPGQIDQQAARILLDSARKVAASRLESSIVQTLADASALATQRLLMSQLRPRHNDAQFAVLGSEDRDGVNWTLRHNVASYGQDADRLAEIATALANKSDSIIRVQLQNLRLLGRFYLFISKNWQVTDQTRETFEQAGNQFIAAIAKLDPTLASDLRQLEFTKLAEAITAEGLLNVRENQYSKKVDLEIEDPALRRAIRSVQPPASVWGTAAA